MELSAFRWQWTKEVHFFCALAASFMLYNGTEHNAYLFVKCYMFLSRLIWFIYVQ